MTFSAAARSARRFRMPAGDVLRVELLAGLVVALALIPEAISCSLIAGVDPKVGLYASFTIAVTIGIAGGRPAMISAATGAMALVVVSLVKDHGVVRYYEEQGRFEPAGRTDGGFRLYTDREVDRLLLIKQMKPLGFTVQQMRELLGAHDAMAGDDKAERQAAEGRIAEFAQQAVERCEHLRDQLARAEEFARRIAAHAPRSGR